ncbi:MAG: phosphate butyryltransferase, partial [Bacillota bacterium]
MIKLNSNKLDEVLEEARQLPTVKLAVAAAEDEVVLETVKRAEQDGLVEPVLIGDKNKIKQALGVIDYSFKGEIIHTIDNKEAAEKTMELITYGQADLPMKGLLSSKTILTALLKKEYGFRQGKLLNLLTMVQLEKEDRLIFITDAGMNIA